MTHYSIEAARFEMGRAQRATALSIHTIRKAELKKLADLGQTSLEELNLRWLSAPDLTSFEFPSTLKTMSIWQSNRFKSLAGIEIAKGLKKLELRENGNPLDLSALESLASLKTLAIEGGYGKAQRVVGSQVLNGLPLQSLTLINVDGTDFDLAGIASIETLHHLDLAAHMFEPKQLAILAAAKPWYMDQLMKLEQAEPFLSDPCKKCGGTKVKLFLKDAKMLWCPACESEKLQSHLEQFEMLVRQHKSAAIPD